MTMLHDIIDPDDPLASLAARFPDFVAKLSAAVRAARRGEASKDQLRFLASVSSLLDFARPSVPRHHVLPDMDEVVGGFFRGLVLSEATVREFTHLPFAGTRPLLVGAVLLRMTDVSDRPSLPAGDDAVLLVRAAQAAWQRLCWMFSRPVSINAFIIGAGAIGWARARVPENPAAWAKPLLRVDQADLRRLSRRMARLAVSGSEESILKLAQEVRKSPLMALLRLDAASPRLPDGDMVDRFNAWLRGDVAPPRRSGAVAPVPRPDDLLKDVVVS